MLVYGFGKQGLSSLEFVATMLSLQIVDVKLKGTAWQFTVKRDIGRRSPACWHCHRLFFERVFAAAPAARVITGLATYNGSEEFRRAMRQAPPSQCECKERRHG
jgi:hypothetical protein